jgi:long-subunit fatty acid transport protein
MKNVLGAGAALLLTTGLASAGGLDRSGQSVAVIFEEGDYAELSFGYVDPNVTGSGPGGDSGDMAPAYTSVGLAYKTDLDDRVSVAFILDEPFGANVDYSEPGYALTGTSATVDTIGLTFLGNYQINERVSVHGGLRMLSASGEVALVAPMPYASEYSGGSGAGYVLGAAYEIPDIALRAALTYSSPIALELDGSVGGNTLEATMPQTVNLDFQTGIAADTLLFGSIRWADWSETALVDSNLPAPLVDYDQDTITYSVGIGRRFSDAFSGSISIGYEAAQGGTTTDLAPTDGYVSLQVGGAYTMTNGVEISGGVRYVKLGDTVGSGTGSAFENNSAIAVGLKVGYNF